MTSSNFHLAYLFTASCDIEFPMRGYEDVISFNTRGIVVAYDRNGKKQATTSLEKLIKDVRLLVLKLTHALNIRNVVYMTLLSEGLRKQIEREHEYKIDLQASTFYRIFYFFKFCVDFLASYFGTYVFFPTFYLDGIVKKEQAKFSPSQTLRVQQTVKAVFKLQGISQLRKDIAQIPEECKNIPGVKEQLQAYKSVKSSKKNITQTPRECDPIPDVKEKPNKHQPMPHEEKKARSESTRQVPRLSNTSNSPPSLPVQAEARVQKMTRELQRVFNLAQKASSSSPTRSRSQANITFASPLGQVSLSTSPKGRPNSRRRPETRRAFSGAQ